MNFLTISFYIPKYGGNEKEKNPMIFKIKKMNGRELYETIQAIQKMPEEDQLKSIQDNEVCAEIFRKKILKIENLEIDGEKITTGLQFVTADLPLRFVAEIWDAILTLSNPSEEELKNFNAPSSP